MKKILFLISICLIAFSCSSEPEKPKPMFSFKMVSNLKDHSYISFKANVSVETEKHKRFLEKRVSRTKQALRISLKVLIAKQVKDEKKVAKLVKLILQGRTKKEIDVVVTDFVLKTK